MDQSEAQKNAGAGVDLEKAYAHVLQGDLLARSGKYEEAFAEYRKADQLAASLDAHLDFARAIWKRCEGLSATLKLAEHEAGLRVDPENSELETSRLVLLNIVAIEQYDRAVRLEGLGDLDGAIAAYRKALSCWLPPEKAQYALSRALLRNGDPIGAFSEFLQSVVKHPWGKFLTQYALLLVGTLVTAWSLGLRILNHPDRYLPKLVTLPLAIMVFGYFYKRFLRGE